MHSIASELVTILFIIIKHLNNNQQQEIKMSQLYQAKKRMFVENNNQMHTQQEPDFAVFTRSKTNRTNINKFVQQLENESVARKRSVQPQDIYEFERTHTAKNQISMFSKTDRLKQRRTSNDRFQSRSERPSPINLSGIRKNNRRTTTFARQPLSPTIRELSFTQKQDSMYDDYYNNQSPIRELKQTVHHEKVNLIIAVQPKRITLSPIKPIECDKQRGQKYLKQQKVKHEAFYDSMFPPKFSIIYNKRYMYLEEGLKFQRITKIYQRQKIYLIKFCEPTYLNMGKFSSSAVYSALSILSEEPQYVLNLFGNQQVNQCGIYSINLNKDGVWRYFIVDDHMPIKLTLKRSLMFLHSFPQNKVCQIWPSLVEKALAKMYGTYQDLYLTARRGIKQIFTNLTGFPVSQFSLNKDFRSFLVIVDAAIKKKHIVVLQQVKHDFQETAHLKKIESGFSYKVVEVKKNGIVIRNLNDREIVTKLSFQEIMIFSKLLIFRCEKNYIYQSRTMIHKKGYYSILSFSNTEKEAIKGYWNVYQNSQVYYKNHIGSNIQYKKSHFALLLQKEGKPQQSESQIGAQKQTEIIQVQTDKEISIKTGQYRLLVHLCQPKEMNYTIVFYGQKELSGFQRIKGNDKWARPCQCVMPQMNAY